MRFISKYKLELRWADVEYPLDDFAVLKGAYFCGPILKEAAKLKDEDQLILDMTPQHLIFIPDYYQATLKWRGVVYKENKIFFKEATIKGKYVNSIDTLSPSDWILIDCRDHEEKKHPFHVVYWAEVRKESGGDKFETEKR